MEALPRFTALYGALNADRSWFQDALPLRFSALAALASPGTPEEVAAAIREASEDLKRGSGWFSQLRYPLRFVLGALLVQAGDDPGRYLEEVERVREAFRARGLRRGGPYEPMSILILRRQAGQQPIADEAIDRLQAIYEEMKRHHWWLTGPEDLPVCALLAGASGGSPDGIGQAVEDRYQALLGAGFGSGDPLQTASGLLALSGIEAGAAARTFRELAEGFRARGISIWKSDYEELAILAFLPHPPDATAARVRELRHLMEDLRPKPDRSLTFNLAASIAFLEGEGFDHARGGVVGAKAMLDLQHILNARAAAAAGAAGSAS